MYVILLNYKVPLEIVDQHLSAHREFLAGCYSKDYFVVSGPRNPRDGGIIISQLRDRTLLDEIIHQDPFYCLGIADYQVLEFEPVKYHPDFAGFVRSELA